MPDNTEPKDPRLIRGSASFSPDVIAEIQRAAREGIYSIRGFGAKRHVPSFDDLVFLGASMSRYPLEGYREACNTDVAIGERFAKKPIELKIPVTIAGMSFGALGVNAKTSLGRAVNPDDLRRADAIEIVVGQGAKPGGGGMLLGLKMNERVAAMRTLPKDIDQRSACRHPDWTGPDDLAIKITELREITDWEKPIYIKIGASRTYYDTMLSIKAGADAIVLDGMQGGTAATQDVFIEHAGIPTLPAVRQAVEALQEMDMHRTVRLIVSGGIRSGADVAKALALGADAVSIGTAALIALNCNAPIHVEDYQALGTEPGSCHHCHTGRCPVGVATQEPELEARLDVDAATRRVRNYLSTLVLEAQTLARACGKSHLLNLEPEDLAALTIEAAAMAGVPLAGTNWIPGKS